MTFVCLQHHQGWPLPLTTQIAFISLAGSTYTNLKIKLGYLKTAGSARSAFSVTGSRTTNAEVHDVTFSCCCGSWNTFLSNLHQELVLSYLFAICLLCWLLFQCLSVHCCSWMDFQPPYLDQWTTFLALEQPSALIPVVTFVANFAFANSFSEAPNTCYMCRSAICLFGALSQSGIHQCVKPQAMYELSHKGCHKREPGASFCIWVVLYVFFSQASPYIQLALEISQAWDPPFPYRESFSLFFIDRYFKPHLWMYFQWAS